VSLQQAISPRQHLRRDDYTKFIVRALAEFGISDYWFETRGSSHRSVVIRHHGKERFVIFPVSGRGWRGPKHTVADVRRTVREMEA
jgi:hypothetical protein